MVFRVRPVASQTSFSFISPTPICHKYSGYLWFRSASIVFTQRSCSRFHLAWAISAHRPPLTASASHACHRKRIPMA